MIERAVEPETKRIELEVTPDIEEDVIVKEPRLKARRIYRTQRNRSLYAQTLSGLAVMVALLFVPVITLPGTIILVLVAEIYLLDWTYSRVSRIRETKPLISKESIERHPEDEIDRKVVRPGPKDQLIR